jgi:type VI secretion system secreted protein VgrG
MLRRVESIAITTASEGRTMSGPSQALRQIAISTPLGDDVLSVRRCSIREEISRLFRIDLDLISKKSDINFDDIIGKNVTLRLELDDQTRYFNGFISRFVQTRTERSYSVYRATVVPWLWFLTRTSDCRIFQQSMEEPPDEMTVPGMILKLFKDFGFETLVSDEGLSESYREWEFCVQYRETAFNFVSRLMEQEGIAYYFKHENGKHTMMLTDSINAHTPFESYDTVPYHPHEQGSQDKEAITDWVVEKELQPGVFAHNDYDFENPRQAKQKALVTQSTINRAHELAEFQIYDYPGEFVQHGEGESLAKLRIQELQVRHETLRGQATALGLCAGSTFSLEDHPRDDQNREYLLTSVSYEIDAGEFETSRGASGKQNWSCNLTAIPSSQPFRPARITPKPLIQGVQTALVVGPSGDEIHTDDKARVKVQFHWDRYGNHDENSSCWIRVSQPWAGKGWGSQATPRIDQEVIVEFLEGDPDRPIITGRVYNGDQTPPYADGQGVVAGMKSQTHQGSGFNEMSMDDTAGSEKITVHAQFDMNTTVENNQTDVVHNNREATVDVDDKETIGSNQKISVGADQETSITANQKLTVGADQTNKISANQKTDVGGKVDTTIGGKETVNVGADQSITVGAGRKVSVSAADELTVGASLKINASGAIEISSGASIKLSAGAGSIEIGPGGVKINGPVVEVTGGTIKNNG